MIIYADKNRKLEFWTDGGELYLREWENIAPKSAKRAQWNKQTVVLSREDFDFLCYSKLNWVNSEFPDIEKAAKGDKGE